VALVIALIFWQEMLQLVLLSSVLTDNKLLFLQYLVFHAVLTLNRQDNKPQYKQYQVQYLQNKALKSC